jgi:5'-deoxynucleotidase YfbR-like HD superfamily hydrolase
MNTILNREQDERSLTTPCSATAEEIALALPTVPRDGTRNETQNSDVKSAEKQLAALFLPDAAKEFRSRWDAVQRGFVDDPSQAVRQADELVAQVMKGLAETFSNERTKLESEIDQTDKTSTENLRVALRRYRSFFERLLSL